MVITKFAINRPESMVTEAGVVTAFAQLEAELTAMFAFIAPWGEPAISCTGMVTLVVVLLTLKV
jgi:hypothetical protein